MEVERTRKMTAFSIQIPLSIGKGSEHIETQEMGPV